MLVPFCQLPDNARVWIYPSSRKFTPNELLAIRQKTEAFLEQWTAHGTQLQAGLDMPYDRFIVLGLNESIQSASGCSIDASVHFIKQLETTYKVDLLDKLNVSYKQGDYVAYKTLKDFKKMAKDKAVSKNTIVFNHLVQTKAEYLDHWEVSAIDSWHARFFS